MGALYIGMTWIFRIQSEHKRLFATQSKPQRWHQKSALLGILILLSESMGVLSMILKTWQSLLFLHTWSLRDVFNLRAPLSVNWTSFLVSYWALIGNDENAAWLHLLQWMFPRPWAQQLSGMELALQGWMRGGWHWLLTTQGLSKHIPSLLQSQELTCVPAGPLPLTLCRAQGWMKHKHWVGAPLLHQLFEGRSFTGTWFYRLKISTSRADTTHMSFGGLYIMKTNQQNTALFQFRIWSQELCPFLLADWKIISLEKC